MDVPRRRAAARPAGPPDAEQAAAVGPGPAASAAPDATATTPTAADPRAAASAAPSAGGGEQAATAGTEPLAPQHRRRQRAPRAVPAETSGDGENRRGLVESGRPSAGRAEAARADAMNQPDDRPRGEPGEDRRRGDNRDDRRRVDSAVERSLRALVSTRTTQLPFDIAMRAREVAQPSAQDLADAERELVLVRRHYVPPAPLVTKKPDTTGRTGRAEGRRGGRRSGRG